MTRRTWTIAAGVLAGILTLGGATSYAVDDGPTSISCPATVTADETTTTISTACAIPKPAPVTETATVTATATLELPPTTVTETVTVTADPAPVALLGASYGGADESLYGGRAQVARLFFTGGLPADVTNAAFDEAYADGVRTFVLSWKGSQTGAQVAAALQSLPDDVTVYGTYWHEPEDNVADGSLSLATWRSREIEQAAAMRTVGVTPVVILMQWTLNPNSGRDVLDYALPAGTVDLVAFDYYMNPAKGKDDPEGAVDNMLEAARAMGVDETAIAETGVPSSVDQATAVDLVARLRAKVLATPEIPWATYWSSRDFAFTTGTADAWFG